jgi:hypothetical protein
LGIDGGPQRRALFDGFGPVTDSLHHLDAPCETALMSGNYAPAVSLGEISASTALISRNLARSGRNGDISALTRLHGLRAEVVRDVRDGPDRFKKRPPSRPSLNAKPADHSPRRERR